MGQQGKPRLERGAQRGGAERRRARAAVCARRPARTRSRTRCEAPPSASSRVARCVESHPRWGSRASRASSAARSEAEPSVGGRARPSARDDPLGRARGLAATSTHSSASSRRGLAAARVSHAGQRGIDLRAAIERELVLAPGERALVPTGFAVAIPAGYEGQVRPRSGLALHAGVTLPTRPGRSTRIIAASWV